ncbi:MAG: CapA family protein [bacterium]
MLISWLSFSIWLISVSTWSENISLFFQENSYWKNYDQTFRHHRLCIAFIGDIMVHQKQLDASWDRESETYNFNNSFKYIRPYLQQADLVTGNLETTFGQDDNYTGYPMFNTPPSLAPTLFQSGIEVVTTANNHCLDRGFNGLTRTLAILDSAGIMHCGTYSSQAQSEEVLIIHRNNIKLALLAYTYGTNGIPIQSDWQWAVNLIDLEKIKQDIIKAKRDSADLIVVCIHQGTEYLINPPTSQQTMFKQIFQYGADLVIGTHPHVVQPLEIIFDHNKPRGLIAYSLGNFISSQRTYPRDAGVIIYVDFDQRGNQKPLISSISYIPTWVHFDNSSDQLEVGILNASLTSQDSLQPPYSNLNHQHWQQLIRARDFVSSQLSACIESDNTMTRDDQGKFILYSQP